MIFIYGVYIMKQTWNKIMPYLAVILGSSIYAVSINLFVVSLNLYSTGLLGFSQVIRSIINMMLKIDPAFDYSGIINFALNIPLYILAYKSLSKKFFTLSLLSTVTQTIVLTLAPIPQTMILDDVLTSLLVAGLVGGAAVGLCLRVGGSSGGFDILGVYFSLKMKSVSVGKLSMTLNAITYTACALLFDVRTAIYSILFVVIFSTTSDKMHLQNIMTQCMIFTHSKETKQDIINELRRGVTYWQGYGAYTDNGLDILVTLISKYEVNRLKRIAKEKDPSAFIICTEGVSVTGNVEKRLVQ